MSLVLATASVQIKYGTEFQQIITEDGAGAGETAGGGGGAEAVAVAVEAATGAELRVPFSLLVGADGGRSAVRREIGASYAPQEQIDLAPFTAETERPLLVVPGLNQTTLILAYEMTGAFSCCFMLF